MKRAIIAVCCLMLLADPASAQEPITHTLYLPLIVSDMPTCQRPWRFIEPQATTNHVLNPSAEIAGNFAAVGGGAMARSTTYQHYGLYSYHVTTAADDQGGSLTLQALANAAHYVTLRVRGVLSANWDWSLDNAHYTRPALLESLDPDWNLYGLLFPAAQANGATVLYVRQNGAGAGDFYLDGIQVEALTYWTTYCDGDQAGCEWNGVEHASTSTRSAQSRAGGRVRDFWQDYGFFVEEMLGVGAATNRLEMDSYALLPGGTLNEVKVQSRQFTLVGRFVADSEEQLHRNRQALIQVLAYNAYPPDAGGWQPVRLRYAGAEVQKQIAAHYDGGLEAKLSVSYGPFQVKGEDSWRKLAHWTEKATLRFSAPDPFWYEIGESAALLDTSDSATMRLVTARLRDTGQWNVLGPPAAGPPAVYNFMGSVAEDAEYIYYGGDFQNFNNNGNSDYIVRYNKQTGAWSALGSGLDGHVRALVITPTGDLIAGGAFHNSGVLPLAHIGRWDGVNWNVVGAGFDDEVYALAIGHDSQLYAVGAFLNSGIVPVSYIARFDWVAWNALGAGVDNVARALAVAPSGDLFVGGHFHNAGGAPAAHVSRWTGAAWATLGAGVDDNVYALAVDPASGLLYAGGIFVNAGGSPAWNVASFNGTSWSALWSETNPGLTNSVWALEVGPDGLLYVGGAFLEVAALRTYLVIWNGSAWVHPDIQLPTPGGTVSCIHASASDPVVATNYDVWTGSDRVGTPYFAGLVAIAYPGTAPAYPTLNVERMGGTSATLESLRNETTGKMLWFNYDLANGERLTVDLTPTEKSIYSNFFGTRMDAVLPNSDFGEWNLKPGGAGNDVTSFVYTTGAPTILAWLQWKDTFASLD